MTDDVKVPARTKEPQFSLNRAARRKLGILPRRYFTGKRRGKAVETGWEGVTQRRPKR